jgi:hypothetical protein
MASVTTSSPAAISIRKRWHRANGRLGNGGSCARTRIFLLFNTVSTSESPFPAKNQKTKAYEGRLPPSLLRSYGAASPPEIGASRLARPT